MEQTFIETDRLKRRSKLSVVTKICIPVLGAVIPYFTGSEFQHVLVGLLLGFLIDTIWILLEIKGSLHKFETSIAPLHQLVDFPLKRIDGRIKYITDALRNSDEIIFVTHTATGWLSRYLDEFEMRLASNKKTVLYILDPETESFSNLMSTRKKWNFSPSKIKLPRHFLTEEDRRILREIDYECRNITGDYSEYFTKKYRKIVDILQTKESYNFFVVLLREFPSVNLTLSKKGHYVDEFYAVLKNSSDSNFDLIAKIDANSGEVYQLYMNEFRRIKSVQ